MSWCLIRDHSASQKNHSDPADLQLEAALKGGCFTFVHIRLWTLISPKRLPS